jgi:hypothetical protein
MATKIVESINKKPIWDVIDLIVKFWEKKFPDEASDVEKNIYKYKETAFDPKFGQTKNGKDFDRRLLVAFPRKLMLMIRTIYSSEDLPMDTKFYLDFLKRYPRFQVAEKV